MTTSLVIKTQAQDLKIVNKKRMILTWLRSRWWRIPMTQIKVLLMPSMTHLLKTLLKWKASIKLPPNLIKSSNIHSPCLMRILKTDKWLCRENTRPPDIKHLFKIRGSGEIWWQREVEAIDKGVKTLKKTSRCLLFKIKRQIKRRLLPKREQPYFKMTDFVRQENNKFWVNALDHQSKLFTKCCKSQIKWAILISKLLMLKWITKIKKWITLKITTRQICTKTKISRLQNRPKIRRKRRLLIRCLRLSSTFRSKTLKISRNLNNLN